MTVIVQAPPYKNFFKDFIPGETIGQLVQRIKDDEKLEFRGEWSVQDTTQSGRICDPAEIVLDNRLYHLNVMIAQ